MQKQQKAKKKRFCYRMIFKVVRKLNSANHFKFKVTRTPIKLENLTEDEFERLQFFFFQYINKSEEFAQYKRKLITEYHPGKMTISLMKERMIYLAVENYWEKHPSIFQYFSLLRSGLGNQQFVLVLDEFNDVPIEKTSKRKCKKHRRRKFINACKKLSSFVILKLISIGVFLTLVYGIYSDLPPSSSDRVDALHKHSYTSAKQRLLSSLEEEKVLTPEDIEKNKEKEIKARAFFNTLMGIETLCEDNSIDQNNIVIDKETANHEVITNLAIQPKGTQLLEAKIRIRLPSKNN